MQYPPTQASVLQSLWVTQVLGGSHFGQLGPPQSSPVSLPFLMESVQEGVWQMFVAQTPLSQSEP
jgi:hypothetical protein